MAQSQNTKNNNFLLSLALFKKLYDEERDIYEIIKSLISHELSNDNSIVEFTLIDIANKINNRYSFEIPEAVVKKALNKLKKDKKIELKNSKYSIIKEFEAVEEVSESSPQANTYIINTLSDYIKIQTEELQFDVIEKSLESFFLNKHDENNIYPYIEGCIIKEASNAKFIDALNEIKYGLILYESISCGIDDINPSKWSEKIMFLDTEILFYLASYNGELFKKISQDFFDLITIVNKNKTIIKLRFFEDTKQELDGFFNVAESIIKKKTFKKQNDVISYILKKCESSSDIVTMKTDFYAELSKNKIKKYENKIDYNNPENYQYNLECGHDLDDKAQEHLKQLSHTNILRKGYKCKTLDEVQYLFLTETRDTIQQSIQNKDKNDFPLALSLFDLTNQLWIKTNKGLGNENLPATFDIRNRAKIALSSSLAKKVTKEYDKVCRQYSNKEVDKESCINRVADLRKKEVLPDDVDVTNCEDIINLIVNPDSMQKHYEEKDYLKVKVETQKQQIQSQNSELKTLRKDNIERKNKNKKTTKIIIYVLIIFILFYFKNEILDAIPFLFLGGVIDGITFLAVMLGIFTYFEIDIHKIKSYFKKET